ncbi:MAG: hypothetical protein M3P23_00635, partial [Actinomycetota bacterium]|nr:hypothetical protein [Actinomycetota bacterium]
MPLRMITLTPPRGGGTGTRTVDPGELAQAFAEVLAELKIPDAFPPEVEAAAREAAAAPQLPSADLTDLPFFT